MKADSRCYVSIGRCRTGNPHRSEMYVDKLLYLSEHSKDPAVRNDADKRLRQLGIRPISEAKHEVVIL